MMATGIARYADALPRVSRFVSLGEGSTPVVELDRIAADLGLRRLTAKLEQLNPTGSYKDRVAAMSMSLAVDRGDRGWIATSSGNAGAAFAAYGARAQLPGYLCVIAGLPSEKKLPLVPYGAKTLAVEGVGEGSGPEAGVALMWEVQDAAAQHGLFLGITANAFNPDGMRGIDTIGYEIAEQRPTVSHLYVPTGGGGLLICVARGLDSSGIRARVIACQPSGCAPIARHLDGELDEPVVDRCETAISALQLPHPPDAAPAAEAVRASEGWGGHVDDDEILNAQRILAAREGIFVEPAAATGLAVLRKDVEAGRVAPDDDPMLILTGAGWKDLSRFADRAGSIPISSLGDVRGRINAWAEAL